MSNTTTPRSTTPLVNWIGNLIPPLLVFVLFLAVWHFVVSIFQLPKAVLPSPLQVANAGWENRELLLKGLWATGKAAALG
ncbi:MAG: ABC transporter permease, partial [Planctomycetota bacterium]